jgi:formylglycine-generating enzyme required for sulfatase activity
VTQAQYRKVMGNNPSYFCAEGGGKDTVKGRSTDDFPVENLSWDDAVTFCQKLSVLPAEQRSGRKYRLPREAEWEYSCRAGAPSEQVFHFGNSLSSKQANFNGNHPFGGADKAVYLAQPCQVGSYKPNAFSLYDMHGNVAEWCADWYDKDYYAKSPRRDPQGPSRGFLRVIRGGGWYASGQYCRSADRHGYAPTYRRNLLGFRVAVVPSEE